MRRQKISLIIFGLTLILLSGCTGTPPVQQTATPMPTSPSHTMILLKPTSAIPAICTPTSVYFFGKNADNLDPPWVAATPASSGIVAHLFFAQVTPANKPAFYEPMHTKGMMPGGGSTKILWRINNASAIGEITITGKNLFRPGNTFQQTFVAASSGIPSIVDVPTSGCWRFNLISGSDRGTAIFWVLP
jgi:hypothetical protein